jgi:ABC-type branched-subunit amino acid transport system ATPase component/ABC-type branched-subunit amino acid transport system permease subunit
MNALPQRGAASTVTAYIAPSISIASASTQIGILAIGGTIAILVAGDGSAQMTITLTLLYIAYALAWNIVAGFAGQFTFGHAAFFGLGAYTATLLTQWYDIPPLLGVWPGVLIAAVAAAIIGLVTLKLRGLYFGLATVVFPIVFSVFATYLGYQEVAVPFKPEGGILFYTPADPRVLSAACLCAAIGVAIISVVLVRSRLGLFFGALRADQDAAEASGVGTTRVKIYALLLSAALSAIAGGLYASVALVVTPADVFGTQMSVKPVLFSVFGGIGTLAGPMVGAAILVPLSDWLTAAFGSTLPDLSGLVYGAALLLVIVLMPGGIVPVVVGAWQRWRARRVGTPVAEARAGVAAPVLAMLVPGTAASCDDDSPILAIDGVAKAFGGTKVLLGVTMQVRRGEILGVIGPNGAGKTTLFNIVNGFLRPDRGAIRLAGHDILRARPSAVARAGLGRTFQTVRVFSGMSAVENVLVAALTRHRTRHDAVEWTWKAMLEVGLAERAHMPSSALTTGELRRLELARAMAAAGPGGLLMLDEFLGGLTKADSAVLMAALERWRARGGSVLVIEHTMRAMAGFVDRFVVLNFGEVIAQGLPEEILRNRAVVTAYLGEKWVA